MPLIIVSPPFLVKPARACVWGWMGEGGGTGRGVPGGALALALARSSDSVRTRRLQHAPIILGLINGCPVRGLEGRGINKLASALRMRGKGGG